MARDELREAARRLVGRLEESHGVRARWDSDDRVCMQGAGVNGELSLGDDEVVVSVRLNLMASAFQGRLKSQVQRYLDKYVT